MVGWLCSSAWLDTPMHLWAALIRQNRRRKRKKRREKVEEVEEEEGRRRRRRRTRHKVVGECGGENLGRAGEGKGDR